MRKIVQADPENIRSIEKVFIFQSGARGPAGSDATVNAQNVGDVIAGADVKTTPVDADSIGISDSAASGILKKLTFANLWVWIKAKTDLLYDISYTALAVADLSDQTSPHVLTIAETTGKMISTYKAGGAALELEMVAPHTKGNIGISTGDTGNVDISPTSGDLFYFNAIAMAVDEHIQFTAGTLDVEIFGVVKNINGTLRWSFKSSDAGWVEATP